MNTMNDSNSETAIILLQGRMIACGTENLFEGIADLISLMSNY